MIASHSCNLLECWTVFAIYTTKQEVLQKLQADLNVDALLIVSVSINLNNSSMFASLVGQGKFQPIATTSLQLLDAKTESKIWFESAAEGEPAKSEEKNFLGMADEEKLNVLAVRAADNSYVKLFEKYKDKLNN